MSMDAPLKKYIITQYKLHTPSCVRNFEQMFCKCCKNNTQPYNTYIQNVYLGDTLDHFSGKANKENVSDISSPGRQ
jgi:hypothetical protein